MANQTAADLSVKPADHVTKYRRIVTAHDENGNAYFAEDKICENAFCMAGMPDFVSTELWRMEETPADNNGKYEDPAKEFILNPPAAGNVIRMLEIPPLKKDAPPTVHRTPSLDYAIVIKGKTVAILEEGVETEMEAGDVLIQRGTVHAWDNRTDEPCIILFILNAANVIPQLPPR